MWLCVCVHMYMYMRASLIMCVNLQDYCKIDMQKYKNKVGELTPLYIDT